ncbi:glycoside hydrolase family 6 protein [Actinomycetospora chibensis]|uniref:Glucanase n=1 Tax=Actinomycetospora chibensis TaxID=663606 RepID=A0ABV9RRS5_9PSEU|nr:glycoside hydrolase family 6 protein [Actinomycetospora chibensis]MDD7924286.1 glycoside hydrolase family 6 protein [Actinomycetospora chibensis]
MSKVPEEMPGMPEADTQPIRIEPPGAEPRGAEPRSVETRGVETRGAETRAAERRGGSRRPRRGWLVAGVAVVTVVATALGVAACSGESGEGGSEGGSPVAPAASEFWVDPGSAAARQIEQWRSEGRTDEAAALEKIARQPVAIWPTGETGGVEGEVAGVVSQARAAGRTPVLTAYNIPNRDCGQYSSGGAEDEGAYREWLDAFARGLGGTRSVVVLEPDALPQTLTNCEGQGEQQGREELLAEAVRKLTSAGGEVYIDAGNPGFVTDIGKLADGLRKSGVNDAAGFALNVANFMETDQVEAYGKRVSDELGGTRFVIDTSRNGNGTYNGPEQPSWCNPPGRALGSPPTRDTGNPQVAAFLWVKEPGDSDGDCRGAPAAGDFWPQYALDLARNTPGA